MSTPEASGLRARLVGSQVGDQSPALTVPPRAWGYDGRWLQGQEVGAGVPGPAGVGVLAVSGLAGSLGLPGP